MAKRKRGPISKKVRKLCYDLFARRISENEFKIGIVNIIDEQLADEIDPKIRKAFEHWVHSMMK